MRKGTLRHSLIWMMPLILMLVIYYLVPLLDVFRLSFTNTVIGNTNFEYSISSYKAVVSDSNLPMFFYNTLIFVGFSVILQLGIGLIIGLLLECNYMGAGLLKVAMISAWVVPGIVTGIMWEILLSTSNWGFINNIIEFLIGNKIPFLFDPKWAITGAVIANVWRGTGFSGLMQYSALKGIDPQLFEAAHIDGAGTLQRFRYITLPQLKPMLLINLVLISINTMNTYDSIWALTKGGPGVSTTVLALQTYRATFQHLSLGQGGVYAVLMVIFSLGLTITYMRAMGGKEA